MTRAPRQRGLDHPGGVAARPPRARGLRAHLDRVGRVLHHTPTDRPARQGRARPRGGRPRRWPRHTMGAAGGVAGHRGGPLDLADLHRRAVARLLGRLADRAAGEPAAVVGGRAGTGGRAASGLPGRGGEPVPRRRPGSGDGARRVAGPVGRGGGVDHCRGGPGRHRPPRHPGHRRAHRPRRHRHDVARPPAAPLAPGRPRGDSQRDRVHRRHLRRRSGGAGRRCRRRGRGAVRAPQRRAGSGVAARSGRLGAGALPRLRDR